MSNLNRVEDNLFAYRRNSLIGKKFTDNIHIEDDDEITNLINYKRLKLNKSCSDIDFNKIDTSDEDNDDVKNNSLNDNYEDDYLFNSRHLALNGGYAFNNYANKHYRKNSITSNSDYDYLNDIDFNNSCANNDAINTTHNKTFNNNDSFYQVNNLSKINESDKAIDNDIDKNNNNNQSVNDDLDNDKDIENENDNEDINDFENSKKIRKHKNSIKLIQSARSSSSSVLSIDRFKRIKSKRRSSSSQTSDRANNRKIIYAKNLLNQIEGLHIKSPKNEEKHEDNNTNENKTLDALVDIYNSELNYLNLLRKAFETYAEPLRKFTSLNYDEYNLLFGYLEPIISLSYNLSIKLEKLIKLWPCDIIGNSGKLFGKKLFQSYEEYLSKYPLIIKLLNQKLKENEIRDLCEIRQINSDCQLSLKHILSAPLERIQYYEKSLQFLNDTYYIGSTTTTTTTTTTKPSISSTLNYRNQKVISSGTSQLENINNNNSDIHNSNYTTNNTTNNNTTTNSNSNSFKSPIKLYSLSKKFKSHRISFISSSSSSSSHRSSLNGYEIKNQIELSNNLNNLTNYDLTRTRKTQLNNEISSPSLIFWQKMKDKSQSLINLNNQMNDSDRTKFNNLASIQKTFPNDDLNLFETLKPKSIQNTTNTSSNLLNTPTTSFRTTPNNQYAGDTSTLRVKNTKITATPIIAGSSQSTNSKGQSFINFSKFINDSNNLSSNVSQTTTAQSKKQTQPTTLGISKSNTNGHHLFGSNLELSSTGNTNLINDNTNSNNNNNNNNKTFKINHTPSISISPNQNLQQTPTTSTNIKTPVNKKLLSNSNSTTTTTTTTAVNSINNNNNQTSTSGGGAVSSSKSSFVSRHLLIQRRKTIHDIINLDIITNLINSNSNNNNNQDTIKSRLDTKQLEENNSSKSKIKKKLSSSSILNINNDHNKRLEEEEFRENLGLVQNTNLLQISRELIKQGSVQLLNQYGKQDRYLFLFNDLLIIAKQKNENHNKLKYRIFLSEIWLSDCFDTIYWQYKADTSIVIGWPPATNYIADFKDSVQKEIWLQKLKELIAIEKQKEEGINLNIKICYNTDNLGGSEPTQYSQCYTKTVQVKSNETAQEIVNRCKHLFNLETLNNSNENSNNSASNTNDSCLSSTSSSSNSYQLWLKTGKNEPLIPLIGHEFPFAIKMNFLRETGRSVEEDDNSYKFILIDNNSRIKKNQNINNQHYNNNNNNNSQNHNQNLNINKEISTLNNLNLNSNSNSNNNNLKENESVDPDRLHRLRKKMFWNKHSSSSNNNQQQQRALLVSSNQNLNTFGLTDNGISTSNTSKPSKYSYLLSDKKLKDNLNSLQVPSTSNRSNSLHYISTSSSHTTSLTSQDNNSNFKFSSSSASGNVSANKKNINSSSNSSGMASTLKPFYNKLKKSHLFGAKLDKICGPYSSTNNQLPVQIMNLLEKVASEGSHSLMIFRKSASAKLKKNYKEKLDSNQTVDYNDMNVHVAALLLKEYLRDYPDGIIDYHLYNDCINLLKINDPQQKLKTAKIVLSRLPKWNFVCLKHFMCLFYTIASNSAVNKMDTHNISVCVAPSIFHKLDRPNDVESSFKAIAFVEYLIDNLEHLFGSDTFTLLKSSPQIQTNTNTVTNSHQDTQVPNILIEINSDSSSQISKSNESLDKKPTKSTNKREFGRMLNLVTLKGKKSLGSKLKPKNLNSAPNGLSTTTSTSSTTSNLKNTNTDNQKVLTSQEEPLLSSNNDQFTNRQGNSDLVVDLVTQKTQPANDLNSLMTQSSASDCFNLKSSSKMESADSNIDLLSNSGSLISSNSAIDLKFKNQTNDKRYRTSTNNSHELTSGSHNAHIQDQNVNFVFEDNLIENDVICDVCDDIGFDEEAYDDEETDDDDEDIIYNTNNTNTNKNELGDSNNNDNKPTISKGKTNKNRNIFKIKSNSKNIIKNSNKSTYYSVNNNLKANLNQNMESTKSSNKQHDLSSNTLSVDSGLSVPTATNSDPESEKSTNLKIKNSIENLAHDKEQEEHDYYYDFNKVDESNQPTVMITGQQPNNSTLSGTSTTNHYLKRQKRMLALNSENRNDSNNETNNDTKCDNIIHDDNERSVKLQTSHKKKAPVLNLMKQFSESDAYYDLTYRDRSDSSNNDNKQENVDYLNIKRHSIKSMAPLAPNLLLNDASKQTADIHDANNINLVPYETNILPTTYQKTTKTQLFDESNYYSLQLDSRNKNKKTAPVVTDERKISLPIDNNNQLKITQIVQSATVSASILSNDDNQQQNFKTFKTSKSTTTDSKTYETTTNSQTSTHTNKINYSQSHLRPQNHHHHNRPHASRKSIVKINFDKTLPVNYFYDGIQTGLGHAYDLDLRRCDSTYETTSNPNKHSSTVYVSYSPAKIYHTNDPTEDEEISNEINHQNQVVRRKPSKQLSIKSNKKQPCQIDLNSSSFSFTSSDNFSSDAEQNEDNKSISLISIKTNSSFLSNENPNKSNDMNNRPKTTSAISTSTVGSFTKIISNHLSTSNEKISSPPPSLEQPKQIEQQNSKNLVASLFISNETSLSKPVVKRSVSLKADANRSLINLTNTNTNKDLPSRRSVQSDLFEKNDLKDIQNEVKENYKEKLKDKDSNFDVSIIKTTNHESSYAQFTTRFISKVYSSNNSANINLTNRINTTRIDQNLPKQEETNSSHKSFDFLPSKPFLLTQSTSQFGSTLKRVDSSSGETFPIKVDTKQTSTSLRKSTTSIASNLSSSSVSSFSSSNHLDQTSKIKEQIKPVHTSSSNRFSADISSKNCTKNMDNNNNNQNIKNMSTNIIANELNLTGVTWSVPNIRRQFESKSVNQVEMQKGLLTSNCDLSDTNFNSLSRLNRSSVTKSQLKTSQFTSDNHFHHHNQYHHNIYQAYKDINGNPTTYI